ncbi:MAG: hypothetical protein LBB64_07090, partial [Dysgonamonadaceae bacterium]|nr:hypothetical protein [Dysgonamonadaceae bacterium]
MKKYFKFFLVILLAGFVSTCDKDEPAAPFLDIAAGQLVQNFGVEGESKYIPVSTNREITVSVTPVDAWCTAEVRKTQDAVAIYVTVTTNETIEERTAKISVTAQDVSPVEITVNQLGTEASIIVKESGISVEDENLEFSLEITANTPVVFELPAWIHEKAGNPASDGKTYGFTADALPEGEQSRNGNITVKAANPNVDKSVQIPVLQISNDQWLNKENWVATSTGAYPNGVEDNGAEALTDNNVETKWAYYPPAEGPFQITLDTRGDKLIKRIKVTKHCNVKKLDVQVSSDEETWQS